METLLSPEAIAQVKRLSVPRLAYTRSEAAAALGISLDSFERYVQPELRIVRHGKLRMVPARELERWLEDHATRVIGR
jgi:excisionase family DNA binding protein